MSDFGKCPRCDRTVALKDNRFRRHSVVAKSGEFCRMSYMRMPVEGLSEWDFEDRAKLVGELAQHVQEMEPTVVWEYLTCLPGAEVQRLLVIALAGIPIDKPLTEVFGWVGRLPVARSA